MTKFYPGDCVKRTSNFWDELDADTVYFVTEVTGENEEYPSEIRISGGDAWPNFFYTADFFVKCDYHGNIIDNNTIDTAGISGQPIVFEDGTAKDTKHPEDIGTVQQVDTQWDIGESVKKPVSLKEYAERRSLKGVDGYCTCFAVTGDARDCGVRAHREMAEDVVNHPSHYKFANGVEVIDLTEQLNFNCGNVVKYTARAGRKDATKQLEDLQKAEFYIKREIQRVEAAGEAV